MSDYTNKLLVANREQLIGEILRLRGENARLAARVDELEKENASNYREYSELYDASQKLGDTAIAYKRERDEAESMRPVYDAAIAWHVERLRPWDSDKSAFDELEVEGRAQDTLFAAVNSVLSAKVNK